MRRALAKLGLLLTLVSPAAALADALLPDLDRGIAALKAGDLEAAEADLRPLARSGYLEAQVALGRLYSSRGTPEDLQQAEHWLREAIEQDPSARVPLAKAILRGGDRSRVPELMKLLRRAEADGDPDAPRLRLRVYRRYLSETPPRDSAELAARIAKSPRREDRAEALSWYAENAIETPAYYAEAARLCEADKTWIKDCHVHLARYYRVVEDPPQLEVTREQAVALYEAGDLPPEVVEDLARSLVDERIPGPQDPKAAYALFGLVSDHSADATARRARLLIQDPQLDPGTDPKPILRDAIARGSAEAKLDLGRLYMDRDAPDADPQRAERLLKEATAADPRAHFYLGRLYERGYLGRSEPVRAMNHYLLAARGGYARADLSLARMYWQNRGVEQNPINAYVFARIAAENEVPGSRELFYSIYNTMSTEQSDRGQARANEEYKARRRAGTPTAVPRAQPEGQVQAAAAALSPSESPH